MSLLNSGSQWPRPLTAMPAVKSRYFLFSKSHRYEPSPRTKTGGGRAYVATMYGSWSATRRAEGESGWGSGFGREASRWVVLVLSSTSRILGLESPIGDVEGRLEAYSYVALRGVPQARPRGRGLLAGEASGGSRSRHERSARQLAKGSPESHCGHHGRYPTLLNATVHGVGGRGSGSRRDGKPFKLFASEL